MTVTGALETRKTWAVRVDAVADSGSNAATSAGRSTNLTRKAYPEADLFEPARKTKGRPEAALRFELCSSAGYGPKNVNARLIRLAFCAAVP